jgi:MFS family permease
MPLVPKLPRSAWIVLGGDAVASLGLGLTSPFFIVYLHRVRGIDLTLAALALATIGIASIVGNLAGGSLADRFGPRRALIGGLACTTGGLVWLAFVTDAPAAFGAAACIGLGNSTAWPAFDSMLAHTVAVDQRSSAFGLRHATLNLGLGLGALVASAIVAAGSVRSFQVLYLAAAAAVAGFCALLGGLTGVGERAASDERVEGSYRIVLGDRVFLGVWVLAALFIAFGFSQYDAALPPYATSTGGVSAHALALVFAANALAVAVLQLVVLRVVAARRRTSALAAAGAAFAAAWCIAIVAARIGGGGEAVIVFAVSMVVLAVGETLVSPSLGPIVNDLAPDHLRGRYNGTFILGYTAGFIAGPALAGAGLRLGDGTAYFVFLAGGCAVASLLSLRLRRRLPPEVDNVRAGAIDVAPVAEAV